MTPAEYHFTRNHRGSAYGYHNSGVRLSAAQAAAVRKRQENAYVRTLVASAYSGDKDAPASAVAAAAALSSMPPPEDVEVASPPRGPSTTKPPPSGEPFVFNKYKGAPPVHAPFLCSAEEGCPTCLPPGSQPPPEVPMPKVPLPEVPAPGRSIAASRMFASQVPPRVLNYDGAHDPISLLVPGLPPPGHAASQDGNPAPCKSGRFADEAVATRTFHSSLLDGAAVARRRIVPEPASPPPGMRFIPQAGSPKPAKVAPPVRPSFTLAQESPASAPPHVAIDMPSTRDIEALVLENTLLKDAKRALEKEREALHTANIKLQDDLQKAHMAKVKDDHLLLYAGGAGSTMVKREAEARIAVARAKVEELGAGGARGAGGAGDNGNGSLDFLLKDEEKTRRISHILFDAQHSGRINPVTDGVHEVMKYGYNALEAHRIVILWMDNHEELTAKYGCKCHKQGRPHTRCLSHHARSSCNGLNGCHRVPEADLII